MKRLHVHVAVENMEESIKFYSNLFNAEPTVAEHDYAKWMMDEPRVNFAITARGFKHGVDHLGIQVESEEELREVYDRFDGIDAPKLEIGKTNCCYAAVEKSWVGDPQGMFWEAFLTSGQTENYGADPENFLKLRDEVNQAKEA